MSIAGVLTSFPVPTTLRGRYYGCLHLANEETEARTGALLAQVTALENGSF